MDSETLSRFEKSLTTQENLYAQTREDVGTLKVNMTTLQRDMVTLNASMKELATSFTSELKTIVARFEERSKPNLAFLGSLVVLIPSAFVGLMWLNTSQVTTQVAPLLSRITQVETLSGTYQTQMREIMDTLIRSQNDVQNLKASSDIAKESLAGANEDIKRLNNAVASSTSADVDSRRDRAQLNDRVRDIEQRAVGLAASAEATKTKVDTALAEIETQFHATSNITNLMHAEQMRFNAQLWEKTHPGERFATDLFFPSSIYNAPRSAQEK